MQRILLSFVSVCVVLAIGGVASAQVSTVAPTSHAFGDVAVGASDTFDFTITNDGAQPLDVTGITETGTGCVDFAVSPTTAMNIAADASATFTVTFTPTVRGARSCTFEIADDENPAAADTFAASGTGTGPAMVTSPLSLDCGSARASGGSTTCNINVSNPGEAPLTFSASVTSGGGDFSIPATTDVVVAAGGNTNVVVTFDPSATGPRTGEVTITGDGVGNPSDVVALSGTGTESILSPTPSGTLNIGSVSLGENATGLVTVDNTGDAALTITSMAITGTHAAQFSFGSQSCTGQTCNTDYQIDPGADFELVTIRCTPTQTGVLSATLTLTGDQDSGDNVIALACTGTAPELHVTPTSLAFGSRDIGATATTLSFTIANQATGTGSEPLEYTIAKTGTGAAAFTVAPACTTTCTANQGETDTIDVTFTPTARQSYAATLTITSNDPDEGSVQISLSGTGIGPLITQTAPVGGTLAFGAVDVGATSTAITATIQHTGDAGTSLDISSVSLVGTNANQFRITSGTTGAQAVAHNATASWQVVCEPTSTGSKTASLRIVSDALNSGTLNIPLTCTGQQAIFTFSPATGLDFGGVFVGDSSTLTVTITNSGNKNGTISSLMTSQAVFTAVPQGAALPRTLAPGGQLLVDVTFTPVNGTNFTNEVLSLSTDGNPPAIAVPLRGDGRTQGVDLQVVGEQDLAVDLGQVRVTTSVTRQVIVSNSGDTSYTLALPTSDDSDCVVDPVSPTTYPATIAGGGSATFDVVTTPSALAADQCVITITTNVGGGTVDMVTVDFVGVAPDVEVIDPPGMVLDYQVVDVDASQTQTITLRNTGTFPLTIGGCTLSGSSRFALAAPCAAPITVEVDASESFDVVFDPTVEAEESATLTFAVDALDFSQIQIQLAGIGVDQHIDLPATEYMFPDTFRNPDDDDVPTVDVLADNPLHPVTGEAAPTTVTMVVTAQDVADVFRVADAGPYTIDPGGRIAIPVEFRPTAAGVEFTGTVTIFNDTTGDPMAEVTVRGRGIDRNVGASPVVDFGTTGVGIPLRLGRALVVTNLDDSGESYVVRRVVLQGDGPFHIVGGEEARDLAAAGDVRYDVEFVPEEPGEFRVYADIYLDNDDEAHVAVVELTGTAVPVEVGGGGGCQASRGGAGAAAVVVVALALALLGLARRRAPAALALLVALALAAPARAERTRNIELSTFAPAPATEVDGFTIESPRIGVSGAWAISLGFDRATNVLTVGSPDIEMTDVPVSTRVALRAGFAYAFLDAFEAGLRVPFYQQAGSDPQFSGLAPADGGALGDVAVHGKARLLDTGALAMAAAVDVTLPTATEDQFAGVDGPSGHVRALLGWRGGRLGATTNLGFVARQPGDLGDIRQGNALTYGAGTSYRALERLWVVGEAFGSIGMGSAGDGVQQLEGVLGVRYEIGDAVGVSLGGGRGILTGIGSPDVRAFVLVDVAPRARAAGPLIVREPAPPRDTGDDDGDGVVNADDECRADAEDADGFQDGDGCPDLDNDGDGLPDDADTCPLEPEDVDGLDDVDGCVDRDNDKDGIADLDDKCPNEPEDMDGYLDNDGCDEPDNDRDGIPDVIDQCALEPETINGKQDDDGCPDVGESLVMVMPDRIEIFEPVKFDGTSARLSKKSANVLGQVAATLRANRDFVRVRVTVHVHPRGSGDQALSEKRANAVREWLLQWGIEPERIEHRGLGSSRPLAPKSQKGAAQLNDRVEFIILEKAVK